MSAKTMTSFVIFLFIIALVYNFVGAKATYVTISLVLLSMLVVNSNKITGTINGLIS